MTYPQLAVRRVVSEIESGTSVNAIDLPTTNDETGVLKTSSVSNGYFDATENKVVDPDELHRVSCPVRGDRLIVSRMNTPALVGAAGHTQRDYDNLYLPDRLWQVRTSETAVAKFVYWWMQTREYRDQVAAICVGTSSSMQNLSQNDFLSFQMPFPNQSTQNSISEFLDRETAQIDELIGKQKRLIGLLAEKRQATINRAVTKGLDPTESTEPSSVPWIDDFPSHWTEKPMCHFMTGRVDYRGATPKKTDDGIFLVTAKNVRKGYIDYAASTEYVGVDDYDNVMSRGRPALGDILMTMEAPLGNFALVDDPGVALAQRVIKFRPKAELIPKFAVYAMNSPYFQAQLEERATGSTALGLKASKLIELRLVAPSVAEQLRIVDYLDLSTGRIDDLARRSETAMKLLSERRSALISAAVTGKIDVREGAA
ncbi:restriction endonuclease subunit S [Paeniglutamicibacter kerguelensis]|uniref:Type I restriction enzyme S subunit n=1 Tax=Paeniglutamicibacter kerguelensis TaxID=254788 RepID=A0ABS4XJI0_9MICC|nr:type I restriction enzyme S subunit [Paeniglutamicibacter kerguelensis]